MKTKILAGLLLAGSAAFAAPGFPLESVLVLLLQLWWRQCLRAPDLGSNSSVGIGGQFPDGMQTFGASA